MKSIKTFRPIRFTLHLRVARPKRSVGVGADRSASDFQALRTFEVPHTGKSLCRWNGKTGAEVDFQGKESPTESISREVSDCNVKLGRKRLS